MNSIQIDRSGVPDRPIGAGERLGDIQALVVPTLGWRTALERLLRSVGVENPLLDVGEPLGAGLPPSVEIVGGKVIYERMTPEIKPLHGVTFHVTGGRCFRDEDGRLVAIIETEAPNTHMQRLNEQFGLATINAVSDEGYISNDPCSPSIFKYSSAHKLPSGSDIYDVSTGLYNRIPVDIDTNLGFVARGVVKDKTLQGTFSANILYSVFGTQVAQVAMEGQFTIGFQESP